MLAGLDQTAGALLVLLIVAGVFAAFVWERFPPDAVALGGVAALLVLGLLDTDGLLSVFSNHAPVTIAAMFVLSGALVRTGAVDAFAMFAAQLAKRAPGLALGVVVLGVMAASAFVNNTPVVVVMIPVVMVLAQQLGTPASKFLIPISYAAILGGTCTLIGTSTNLLADGVAQSYGVAPFGMFEITGLGLAVGLVGVVYMVFIGQRLLPERHSLTEQLQSRKPRYLAEVLIPHGSPLVGRLLDQVAQFQRTDMNAVDVIRADNSMRRVLADLELQAGDRILLETPIGEIMALREDARVDLPGARDFEPVGTRTTMVVEGLVGPRSRMIGLRVGTLRLHRRYGVYPLAVYRAGQSLNTNIDNVKLMAGDALLLEGPVEGIRRLSDDLGVINLTQPTERAYRRSKAPIAIGTILGIMALASVGILPISALAVIGVAVVVLLRCIDMDEAYQALDGRILVLIFAMLAISKSMEQTGAVVLLVNAMTPMFADLSPWLALAGVYIMTSLMTEVITNNGVAVVVTPIVISLALALGCDPRPFVVAVMFAASASFATPIGYQTNTMVYSAGGYRFVDFLKVGIPMNVLTGAVAVMLIPLFWPLK